MEYEVNSEQKFYFPDIDNNITDEYCTDEPAIYWGSSEWYRYLTRYLPIVRYTEVWGDAIKREIFTNCKKIIICPTIDLRCDSFAQAWGAKKECVIDELLKFKSCGGEVLVIIVRQGLTEIYKDIIKLADKIIKIGDIKESNFKPSSTCEVIDYSAIFCSRTYNPYMRHKDLFGEKFGGFELIAQGSHLYNNSEVCRELFGVLGARLTVYDYDYSSKIYRTKPELLRNKYIGSVDESGYLYILKKATLQIFIDDGHQTFDRLLQRVVESEACGTPVVVYSKSPEKFKEMDVISSNDVYALLEEISLLLTLPEYLQRYQHDSWRKVNNRYSLYGALKRLGLFSGSLKATVITPSIRPDRIENILKNYKSQNYNDKNLVIVANGGTDKEWCDVADQINGQSDIKLIRQPFDSLAGASLNAGMLATDGDICLRFDDDDVYGSHYISDAISHFISSNADLMGKKMEYIYFEETKELVRRKFPKSPAYMLDNDIQKFYNIAGNSFVLKRSFFAKVGFRLGTSGFADSEFLTYLKDWTESHPSKFLYLDSLSLIVNRRGAADHTWKADDSFFKINSMSINVESQYLLR